MTTIYIFADPDGYYLNIQYIVSVKKHCKLNSKMTLTTIFSEHFETYTCQSFWAARLADIRFGGQDFVEWSKWQSEVSEATNISF